MEVFLMNENSENISAATEATETPIDDAAAPEGLDVPKGKASAGGGGAEGSAGVYVHIFRKPFEYEGAKHATLNFYFERLTGRDMVGIEAEMQARNEYAIDPLLSRNFQSKMAARAGGIASDALEAMPIQEFNKIVSAARNFLINTGS
jgi:hypothetical protein